MSKADERNDITVEQYIASLEDATLQNDALTIAEIMQRISGEKSQLYGYGTIGFGVYKYHYESGRKGEAHTLAFYPRKGKITVYLMDGTTRHAQLLAKLGKHMITGYCIYFKRLSDIELPILEQIIQASYDHITDLSKDGPITQNMWRTEK
ncbi:MAG: DUF1801 domain-containing protein [Candidatus Saccharibacteria bacterium]|jgi:hypothetical protein